MSKVLSIQTMGHSFTSFREKHIRSKDYKIEVWLFLLVEKASSVLEKEPWLKEATIHWQEQAELAINGCIDPDLDSYLTNDHQVKVMKNICSSIQSDLIKFGEVIPKEYLNNLCGYKPPYDIKQDNETSLYTDYGSKLLTLLSGNQSVECENA